MTYKELTIIQERGFNESGIKGTANSGIAVWTKEIK